LTAEYRRNYLLCGRYMVFPAIFSYNFGATTLIFCRILKENEWIGYKLKKKKKYKYKRSMPPHLIIMDKVVLLGVIFKK
jgi:hypothetical protein